MMLLDILAKTDALFWPARCGLDARRAIYELRDRYHADGLLWRIGGDKAENKAGTRELVALEASGRLIVNRPPGKQSAYVRLPVEVEEELREQVSMSTYSEAEILLKAIALQVDLGHCYDAYGHRWVREEHLTDADGEDRDRMLAILAEHMLPLLTRGLVVSNADPHGRVWYALATPEAEQRSEELADDDWPAENRDSDPGRRGRYMTPRQIEMERLANLSPKQTNEIGMLPMPVGV